jgi:thioredoxin-related protein
MISFLFVVLFNTIARDPSGGFPSSIENQYEQPSGKSKLIVFSGSDWCKNCILFKKKVLSNPDFEVFIKNRLEIVTADFPQRTTLSKEQIAKNEVLAEKYNPNGEFPRLVLLAADEKTFTVIPYVDQDAGEFIGIVKSLLRVP